MRGIAEHLMEEKCRKRSSILCRIAEDGDNPSSARSRALPSQKFPLRDMMGGK